MSAKGRAAAATASALVFGGLMLGATTAHAADPTPSDVNAQIAALTCANVDTDAVKIKANILLVVDTARDELNDALGAKVKALDCAADPTTTVPTPVPTSVVPTTVTPEPVGDDKDCTDFLTPKQAQDYYDSVSTPGNPDPSKLDSDGDGLPCEAPGVNPTQDDGSVVPDGSQVIEVPEGSASTGA